MQWDGERNGAASATERRAQRAYLAGREGEANQRIQKKQFGEEQKNNVRSRHETPLKTASHNTRTSHAPPHHDGGREGGREGGERGGESGETKPCYRGHLIKLDLNPKTMGSSRLCDWDANGNRMHEPFALSVAKPTAWPPIQREGGRKMEERTEGRRDRRKDWATRDRVKALKSNSPQSIKSLIS